MFLDIGLVLIGVVTQAVAAYLGVHLTINPPASDRKRNQYKFAFVALGLVGLVVSLAQGVLKYRQEEALNVRLGGVQTTSMQTLQNTEAIRRDQAKAPPPQRFVVTSPQTPPPKPSRRMARISFEDSRLTKEPDKYRFELETMLKNYGDRATVAKVNLDAVINGEPVKFDHDIGLNTAIELVPGASRRQAFVSIDKQEYEELLNGKRTLEIILTATYQAIEGLKCEYRIDLHFEHVLEDVATLFEKTTPAACLDQ